SPSYTILYLARRPTPLTPLSPYTTLFRSAEVAFALGTAPRPRTSDGACSWRCSLLGPMSRTARATDRKLEETWRSLRGTPSFRSDRKSTRLHSSHVKISYAVFCLKKKKNK